MPRTRPPFPPEFRREAVKLMRESDKPLPQLAKDLGVSEQTLRDWRRPSAVLGRCRGGPPGTPLAPAASWGRSAPQRRARLLADGILPTRHGAVLLGDAIRDARSRRCLRHASSDQT
jgi:transposase-like protein